jgi:hypothetical protein
MLFRWRHGAAANLHTSFEIVEDKYRVEEAGSGNNPELRDRMQHVVNSPPV